jgi:hypothetical protein
MPPSSGYTCGPREDNDTIIGNGAHFYTLKMDVICFSKTLVLNYQSTLRHIPEDRNLCAVRISNVTPYPRLVMHLHQCHTSRTVSCRCDQW